MLEEGACEGSVVREVRKSPEDVSKAAGDPQECPLDWLSVIPKHCYGMSWVLVVGSGLYWTWRNKDSECRSL